MVEGRPDGASPRIVLSGPPPYSALVQPSSRGVLEVALLDPAHPDVASHALRLHVPAAVAEYVNVVAKDVDVDLLLPPGNSLVCGIDVRVSLP